MDSGPGADAPSRNDDPLDVSGFVESIVSDLSHRAGLGADPSAAALPPTRKPPRGGFRIFDASFLDGRSRIYPISVLLDGRSRIHPT